MENIETSLAIANFFIKKANSECNIITPMKILKLVYISHGWHLGIMDKPLIAEPVVAWKYGPVIPVVYNEFKKYGNTNVDDTGFIFNEKMEIIVPMPNKTNLKFLEKIWSVYKNYTGIQLSALTHEEGTPWDIVWNKEGGKDKKDAIISNDLIKQHYKSKASN